MSWPWSRSRLNHHHDIHQSSPWHSSKRGLVRGTHAPYWIHVALVIFYYSVWPFNITVSSVKQISLSIFRMTLEEEKNTSPIPSRSYNPEREKPMIHPCVDPPACESCQKLELSFFDPECPGCRLILENPNTTVPEIFSVLRQWTPQTQQNLDLLIDEVRRQL